MIQQIRFANFKSFALEQPIQLPRFLVLVGDNGAGKTNFCDAFDFARDVLERGLREALLDERRGGFDSIVRGRKSEREITCQLTFDGAQEVLDYEFRVGLGGRTAQPIILKECVRSGISKTYLDRTAEGSHVLDGRTGETETWTVEPNYLQVARLTDEQRFPTLRRVRDELRSVLVLRPDYQVLRQSATVSGELRLGGAGEGLPAILDAAEPTQLEQLARWLAEGDRATRFIRPLSAEPGKKVIGILERGEHEPYRPEQISDGTLRLLALLTAIMGIAPKVSTLLIEEPENGIHFNRLKNLVKLCRQRTEQDPDAQIILTTHSIPLLHALRREEVMAVVRREEGNSEILPPPDEKKWERFQKEASYTIGDLYTTGLWPPSTRRRNTSR